MRNNKVTKIIAIILAGSLLTGIGVGMFITVPQLFLVMIVVIAAVFIIYRIKRK